MLAKALASTVRDLVCGTSTRASFASFDPGSSSWRTSQRSFDADSIASSVTLPRAGMMRSGSLYALPTLERPSFGTGSSSSRGWPTPSATYIRTGSLEKWEERSTRLREKGYNGNGAQVTLDVAAKQEARAWPTPRAQNRHGTWGDQANGLDLQTAVAAEGRGRFWATPRASEHKGTGPLDSASHEHRLDRGYLDAQMQEAEKATGRLNPDWVETLMGFEVGWTRGPQLAGFLNFPANPLDSSSTATPNGAIESKPSETPWCLTSPMSSE